MVAIPEIIRTDHALKYQAQQTDLTRKHIYWSKRVDGRVEHATLIACWLGCRLFGWMSRQPVEEKSRHNVIVNRREILLVVAIANGVLYIVYCFIID
jgi:hypothetical protein